MKTCWMGKEEALKTALVGEVRHGSADPQAEPHLRSGEMGCCVADMGVFVLIASLLCCQYPSTPTWRSPSVQPESDTAIWQ
jgi:hypothetical protein